MIERKSSEFSQSTPFGKVVNVHIERQTILQTVNKTTIHDEVHTSMTTNFFGHLAILLQNGRLIFLFKSLSFCVRHERVRREIVYLRSNTSFFQALCIKSVTFNRIFIGKPFRTRELIEAVVRTRIHHLVLNLNNLSFLCTNQCCGMITIAEICWANTCLSFHIVRTMNRFSVHCNKCFHAVTTMNVESLCHRT